MRRSKRVLGLTGLTGLLAALVGAVPASAAEPGATAACTVTGRMGMDPPIEISGGHGSYLFDEDTIVVPPFGRCIVSTDDGRTAVATINLRSEGTYDNIFCAGGALFGYLRSTSNAIGVRIEQGDDLASYIEAQEDDLDYEINVSGSVGWVSFHGDPGNASGDGLIHMDSVSRGFDPLGWFATEENRCLLTTERTDLFRLTGHLQFQLPPESS